MKSKIFASLTLLFFYITLSGSGCFHDNTSNRPGPYVPPAPTPDLGTPTPTSLEVDFTTGDPVNVLAQQGPVNVKIIVKDQYGDEFFGPQKNPISTNSLTTLTVTSTDLNAQINGALIPSAGYQATMSNSEADFSYTPLSVNGTDGQETIKATLSMYNESTFSTVPIYGSNTYYVWFHVTAQIRPAGPLNYIYQDENYTSCVAEYGGDGDEGYTPCSTNTNTYCCNDPYDPVCYETCPVSFVGLSSQPSSNGLCGVTLIVQQLSYETATVGGESVSLTISSFPSSPSQRFEIDDLVFGASPPSLYFNNGNSDSSLNSSNGLELSDIAEASINVTPGYSGVPPCFQSIPYIYWRFPDAAGN